MINQTPMTKKTRKIVDKKNQKINTKKNSTQGGVVV